MFKSSVQKYHWGIQATWNIFLQLSNWKQDSAMSGAVVGECIEYKRERPSRDPLV